jgi:FtsH-binding integral membrane protein
MTVSAWLAAVLLLCASIYLGMGFSLVVLQFPGALATTHAANFPERFGAPVRRAVGFFSVVSAVMLAGGIWLTVREWDGGNGRLYPLFFTALVVLATLFTVVFILPVNRALYRDIPDQTRFTAMLGRWMRLNIVRYAFWILEWLAITGWFLAEVTREG